MSTNCTEIAVEELTPPNNRTNRQLESMFILDLKNSAMFSRPEATRFHKVTAFAKAKRNTVKKRNLKKKITRILHNKAPAA